MAKECYYQNDLVLNKSKTHHLDLTENPNQYQGLSELRTTVTTNKYLGKILDINLT